MVKRRRSQNAKQWRAIKNLKRACAPEIKRIDQTDTKTLTAGTWEIISPITVSQGVTDVTRLGNEICIHHLKFQCTATTATAGGVDQMKFVLIRYPTGTIAPPLTDADLARIFEYDTMPLVLRSPLLWENLQQKGFEVLWTKNVRSSTIMRKHLVTCNKSFNYKAEFDLNADTLPAKGYLAFAILSDAATVIQWSCRVQFSDA